MGDRDDADGDVGEDGDGSPARDPFALDADVRDGRDATGADPGDGSDADDAPLDDLASEVRRRRERREADADEADDLFDEAGTPSDPIDGEDVWAALDADADSDATDVTGATDATDVVGSDGDDGDVLDEAVPEGAGGDVERVDGAGAGAGDAALEHVVPKRSYCQRCPYLSAPPRVVCEHEGTDIVDAPDAEHFRVRGCPMVERGGPSGNVE